MSLVVCIQQVYRFQLCQPEKCTFWRCVDVVIAGNVLQMTEIKIIIAVFATYFGNFAIIFQ